MTNYWKLIPFEQSIEKVKSHKKIPSILYKKHGKYPIVSQERGLINGYWDNADDLFYHDIPIIIFGDHTKVVKYVDFNFVAGADGVKILQPKGFINTKYFYYWLCSLSIIDKGYARHYRYLKEKAIPIPPIEEQRRIVEILDKEFERIDALRANAEQSLQNAKALFQATLNKAFEPKEGWQIKKLGEICNSTNGLWKGKKEPFITVGVLRSTNFSKDCKLKLDNVAYIEVEQKSFTKRRLQRNDILVERSGGGPNQPVGRVLLFDIDADNFSFCNFTSAIRVVDISMLSPIYLHRYLSFFYANGGTLNMQSNVIGLRNLDYKKYLDICIPVPPMEEQKRIVVEIERLDNACSRLQSNYEQTIALCNDMKQALLRKAFNGEL